LGSVTSTIEVPFELRLAIERVDRLGEIAGAAVVADIGDVTAPCLKIVG